MSKRFKLTYFDTHGLGEPIRYLLAYSKSDFEDNRITREEWPALKESTPFGQIPLLEFDGVQAYQSQAICRLLAKMFGIAGRDEIEQMQADAIVDTLGDLRSHYVAYMRASDPETKEEKFQEVKTKHNPYYLSRLEEIAKKNGGYFVGGQLTWADIYFAAAVDMLSFYAKDDNIIQGYKTLKELKDKVNNLPGVKAYLAKRPHHH